MAQFHLAASGLARDRWSKSAQHFKSQLCVEFQTHWILLMRLDNVFNYTPPLPGQHPHTANSTNITE